MSKTRTEHSAVKNVLLYGMRVGMNSKDGKKLRDENPEDHGVYSRLHGARWMLLKRKGCITRREKGDYYVYHPGSVFFLLTGVQPNRSDVPSLVFDDLDRKEGKIKAFCKELGIAFKNLDWFLLPIVE